MPFKERRPNEIIAASLRARICLHSTDAVLVLHEGKIAEEFGVSRTPIRQILQSLAHELLVETQAGIGTIAMPLDEGMFERDLKTAQSMLSACARVARYPVSQDVRFSLIALNSMANEISRNDGARAAFFDVATRFLDTLIPTVTDPLIQSTYRASYFRIIRWRLRMFDKDPGITWTRMTALIDAATQAATDDTPGAVFQAMYAHAVSPQYAPWGVEQPDMPHASSNVHNIR